MIVSDGITMKEIKGMGLVNHVITEKKMNQVFKARFGIGHTRYSTQGPSSLSNCQPMSTETTCGTIALAHNGQLINKDRLKKQVISQGIQLSTDSDSEIILKMIAIAREKYQQSNNWVTVIQEFMNQCSMAYSFVMMTHDGIYGVRDPYGNRPLCIGRLNTESGNTTLGWIISSESSPLLSISAKYWREVQPGEIVGIQINQDGSQNFTSHVYHHRPKKAALCIFEYVYFSRSDAILENRMVYSVRYRCGQILATKAPVDSADIISCIPNSSVPAALGYSSQSGIPYVPVLTRNIYVGRTFIQPSNKIRQSSIKRKFGLLTENIFEKKIVLIDDSIVRGNTITLLIQALKASGAKEVISFHLLSFSLLIKSYFHTAVNHWHYKRVSKGRNLDASFFNNELLYVYNEIGPYSRCVSTCPLSLLYGYRYSDTERINY